MRIGEGPTNVLMMNMISLSHLYYPYRTVLEDTERTGANVTDRT